MNKMAENKENKGPASFMSNYNKIIKKVRFGAIIRKQYGGDNDSVIYLSQEEPISEVEKSNLIKRVNKN